MTDQNPEKSTLVERLIGITEEMVRCVNTIGADGYITCFTVNEWRIAFEAIAAELRATQPDPTRLAVLEAENALLRSELDAYHAATLKKLQDIQDLIGDQAQRVRIPTWSDLPPGYMRITGGAKTATLNADTKNVPPSDNDEAWKVFNGGQP